jgi:hypothetical protein
VLRETDPQTTIWDLLLPEEAKRLPAELQAVDAYLDDERFVAPWRGLFSARLGRPSVPVDTLLRLLYLKHRYQLGYESLCREVADSISWRRFCRISLDRPVPHSTTLVKLVRRAGPEVIEELNAALCRAVPGSCPVAAVRTRRRCRDRPGWPSAPKRRDPGKVGPPSGWSPVVRMSGRWLGRSLPCLRPRSHREDVRPTGRADIQCPGVRTDRPPVSRRPVHQVSGRTGLRCPRRCRAVRAALGPGVARRGGPPLGRAQRVDVLPWSAGGVVACRHRT